MPSIEVKDLTKRYHRLTAIQGVSFSVEPGEIVGFLGPNGAGKSTTMRILSGIVPATSGEAYICGIPVASRPDEVKRRIGYMPENNPLPEDMRVIEYLRHRASLKDVPRKEIKSRVDEAMETCDLHRNARKRVIGTLSKGFRQRVGVADAIIGDPEVIIMDEPTIGLDPHQIIAMRKLVDSLRGKMTVIISSHILAEVEVSCDRVIIINQGRIVACGDPDSLRREFANRTHYVTEIKGDLAEAGTLLREIRSDLQWSATGAEQGDGFRTVEIVSEENGNLGESILEAFLKHPGMGIRSLQRIEPNLEDIFLAATKRSWDETIPAADGSKGDKTGGNGDS